MQQVRDCIVGAATAAVETRVYQLILLSIKLGRVGSDQ